MVFAAHELLKGVFQLQTKASVGFDLNDQGRISACMPMCELVAIPHELLAIFYPPLFFDSIDGLTFSLCRVKLDGMRDPSRMK